MRTKYVLFTGSGILLIKCFSESRHLTNDSFAAINVDIDAFEEVLETLPFHLQVLTLEHLDDLQEIRLIYGYPVVLTKAAR